MEAAGDEEHGWFGLFPLLETNIKPITGSFDRCKGWGREEAGNRKDREDDGERQFLETNISLAWPRALVNLFPLSITDKTITAAFETMVAQHQLHKFIRNH